MRLPINGSLILQPSGLAKSDCLISIQIRATNSYLLIRHPTIRVAAQVTKQFNIKWDAYIGVENLTNYSQKNLIISCRAAIQFSRYFDGSNSLGSN